MNLPFLRSHAVPLSVSALLIASVAAQEKPAVPAQAPAPTTAPTTGGRGQQPPPPVSPEVLSDRRVTFRLLAPQAQAVELRSSDIPGGGATARQLTNGENGVWAITLGPLEPGAYRYTFGVDGAAVIDARNTAISQSNVTLFSLVHVPGSAEMDATRVPHGAVAAVHYYSTSLGRDRRMHVYTPPGYEAGRDKYPVFYLLHGSSDSDHSWSSVGRTGFILDNLIAAKRAKPMIVVMPHGHTSSVGGGRGSLGAQDEFAQDFVKDVMPHIESRYRVMPERSQRAIAGLSMGGAQTLNIAIPHLDKFAYIGVYSSGLIGVFGGGRGGSTTPSATPPATPEWETRHLATLDNASLKRGLELLWVATGVDDGLLPTTRATVELFKRHGFSPVYKETPGGHTWLVWRAYLQEFAPLLFK